MANPRQSASQLVDRDNNPMMTTQQSLVSDAPVKIAITYTANDPTITTDGAITVADGSTPTVAELLEFCEELNDRYEDVQTQLNAALDILEAHGLMADA